MSKSSFQNRANRAAGATAVQTKPTAIPLVNEAVRETLDVVAPRRQSAGAMMRALQALASLRLTVVLFALSLVLVFVGTLAQMDAGIGTVVKEYFRWFYVWVPLQLFVRFGQVFFGIPYGFQLPGSFPFPGGWTLGTLLLVNLLAAHAIRFRLTWKRSGILILHTGLIVLMVGELLTGVFASEGQMTILAGGTSNVIKHREFMELAVTGPLETARDEVTVVSGRRLRAGGSIQSDQLPFDVQVDEYMPNSRLKDIGPEAPNRATAGDGLGVIAEVAREGAGVDAEQRVDFPSAYLTLKDKATGNELGKYLVSTWISELVERPDQKVTVDGKTYEIALRFKRTYTPYTFQLLEFRHERYPGTDVPKNFSSDVRILDPEQGVDRQAKIYMNAPLRYQRTTDDPWWQLLTKGQETFYQQGFLPGDTGTILQVVRNPGWLAPYLACVLVGVGMLIHFSIVLLNFLKIKAARASGPAFVGLSPATCWWTGGFIGATAIAVFGLYMSGYYLLSAAGFLAVYAAVLILLHWTSGAAAAAEASEGLAWYVPWMVVGTAAACVLVALIPPGDEANKPHLQELARLPVQATGRVKPLDTVARTALAGISDYQTYKDDKKSSHSAVEWFLDVMTSRLPDNKRDQLPEHYKVFRIENDQVLGLLGLTPRDGLRYAPAEFAKQVPKLLEEAEKADAIAEKDRSVYQTKVLELANKIQTYIQIARLAAPRLLPPADGQKDGDWLTLPQAAEGLQEGPEDKATLALFAALRAYAEDRPKEFNDNLRQYRLLLAERLPEATSKADFETFFNHFDPFFVCMPLYIGVFILAAISWAGWTRPLNRAAFWLACLAVVVHTFGLAARMYIQGRPPVTNLYSSAVFIGWMCVLLGLALEVIFHIGIGNALAGILGFLGVLIAHNLANGDTLEMMRAVLDTNFWLATHVVCITIGYAATFSAGLLGIAYLVGLIGQVLAGGLSDSGAVRGEAALKPLAQMTYGILCFATLFSFVGTVLGGIWADQSWGRFWGWDPKENGALLIVIMNALVLHARWSGLVKARGMAVLTVIGNIVTGWSWFGTNQLGVGLHAYGFNNGLAKWLTIFWATQFLVVAVGLLPLKMWAPLRADKA